MHTGGRTILPLALAGATALAVLSPTALAASRPSLAAASTPSGIITYAEQPGDTPNFILPFPAGADSSVADTQLQEQMWPPLFTIGTANNPNVINSELSLANPPVYTDNDTTVTMTLKSFKWSDGTPVTSRDITFYLNLMKANKTISARYTPGNLPDNLKSCDRVPVD